MKTSNRRFQINLDRAENLIGIHESINDATTKALDCSDVLRGCLVMAVSALDLFVHDLVRIGILDTYRGRLPPTKSFRNITVPLGTLLATSDPLLEFDWLEETIRQQHGWRSFEHPKNITEALRLVSDDDHWAVCGKQMKISASEVQTGLASIIDRRNKIVHEFDVNPIDPQELFPINPTMVKEAVGFIREVGNGIYYSLINQYPV